MRTLWWWLIYEPPRQEEDDDDELPGDLSPTVTSRTPSGPITKTVQIEIIEHRQREVVCISLYIAVIAILSFFCMRGFTLFSLFFCLAWKMILAAPFHIGFTRICNFCSRQHNIIYIVQQSNQT